MKYKIQILLPIALAVFSSTPRAASITVETSSDLKKMSLRIERNISTLKEFMPRPKSSQSPPGIQVKKREHYFFCNFMANVE